jgi:energy-coupling factor transporter ATP-binding protein EcfA2
MLPVPRLHRLKIEGFRRIREPLELRFLDPAGKSVNTMVIAGQNGCGKTSVLEALLLALGEEQLIVRDLPANERDDHWRATVPEDARIEIEVSIDDQGPFTWYRTAGGFGGVSNEPAALGLFQTIYPGMPGGGWAGPSAMGVPRIVRSDKRLAVEYFSSWRSPALVGALRPLGPGNRPRDTEVNRLWRLKQYLIDEKGVVGYGVQRRDEAWLRDLNAAWALLHGHDGTRLDTQLVDSNSPDRNADLFILEPDGTRRCAVDHASSGEIELLSFAGWIVLNDFRAGLLVIDEPELHLHPQWQKAILPALRELAPDVQMIVATHADAPWDQVMSFERTLLVPPGDPRHRRDDAPADLASR